MASVPSWLIVWLFPAGFFLACLARPRYAKNVLVAIDQLASALLGGDPDETISSRLGKAQRGDHGTLIRLAAIPAVLLVNALFYPIEGWGHCRRHIEEDEGRDGVGG